MSKGNTQPRTELQKAAHMKAWCQKWELHPFSIRKLNEHIRLSAETMRLIAERNDNMYELRDAIEADYQAHKKKVLQERSSS